MSIKFASSTLCSQANLCTLYFVVVSEKCVNDFILVDADMDCLWKLSIIFLVILIEYTNN